MGAFSNYLEAKIINHVLRNTTYTSPGTSVYIGLCTADPTDAWTTTNELADAGAYARVQCSTWNDPSGGGATANTNEISFPQASANWGTITHVIVTDGNTIRGNSLLFYGSLTTQKTVNSGDIFKIAAGDLDITLD